MTEHPEEVAHLVVEFEWGGDRLHDLGAHEIAVAAAKATDGGGHGAWGQGEASGGLVVAGFAVVRGEVGTEFFELAALAAGGLLLA